MCTLHARTARTHRMHAPHARSAPNAPHTLHAPHAPYARAAPPDCTTGTAQRGTAPHGTAPHRHAAPRMHDHMHDRTITQQLAKRKQIPLLPPASCRNGQVRHFSCCCAQRAVPYAWTHAWMHGQMDRRAGECLHTHTDTRTDTRTDTHTYTCTYAHTHRYSMPGQGFKQESFVVSKAPFELKLGPCWGRPHVTGNMNAAYMCSVHTYVPCRHIHIGKQST